MKKMNNYKCTVCSYTYRPERGDKNNEIKPGTDFNDLPENWKCPTCNQPKMAFVEVKIKY
jgi:rubredoxin